MKIARFWRLAVIVLIAVVTIALGSAEAQQEQATVRLDGRTVFRVSAVGDRDTTARARQVERRMARLLGNPNAIAPPQIQPAGANNSERVISIAGVPIVTVTTADAQDNLTTSDRIYNIYNNVCGIFAYYILGLLSLSLHFVNFK